MLQHLLISPLVPVRSPFVPGGGKALQRLATTLDETLPPTQGLPALRQFSVLCRARGLFSSQDGLDCGAHLC
jgi:hypothetical protein